MVFLFSLYSHVYFHSPHSVTLLLSSPIPTPMHLLSYLTCTTSCPLCLTIPLPPPSPSLCIQPSYLFMLFPPGGGDRSVLCLLPPRAESTWLRWILQPQVSSQNNGRTRQEVCGWLRHLLPQVKVSNPHCNSTTR